MYKTTTQAPPWPACPVCCHSSADADPDAAPVDCACAPDHAERRARNHKHHRLRHHDADLAAAPAAGRHPASGHGADAGVHAGAACAAAVCAADGRAAGVLSTPPRKRGLPCLRAGGLASSVAAARQIPSCPTTSRRPCAPSVGGAECADRGTPACCRCLGPSPPPSEAAAAADADAPLGAPTESRVPRGPCARGGAAACQPRLWPAVSLFRLTRSCTGCARGGGGGRGPSRPGRQGQVGYRLQPS